MKKFIFAAVIFTAALPILIALIGLFMPQEVFVSRSAEINASPQITFNFVNNLKKWELWSPWHLTDTAMKISYQKQFLGEGASYSWQSEKHGNGKLSIKESLANEKILTEMDFSENGTASGEFLFEKVSGGTVKVTWSMRTDMGESPFAKFSGIFMEYFVGKSFETGLQSLKEVAERKANEKPQALPVSETPKKENL
jgi:hypothetical protein